jgi:HEAT repeat protein
LPALVGRGSYQYFIVRGWFKKSKDQISDSGPSAPQSPDREIRLSATTALGSLKSGRPVDELIGRLRDQSEEMVIREQAAVALTAIRSTGALRGLREFIVDEDEDAVLRSYTGSLLTGIGSW